MTEKMFIAGISILILFLVFCFYMGAWDSCTSYVYQYSGDATKWFCEHTGLRK